MSKHRKSTDSIVQTSPVPRDRVATDILITISDEELQAYISGKRDIFFRINPWDDRVENVWIYCKEPIKAVAYVATVGDLKLKGDLDEVGVHNKAFNSGSFMSGKHKYKAAYELKSLGKLKTPLDYGTIVEQEWSRAIAHANVYLHPDMADWLRSATWEDVLSSNN